MSVKSEPFRPEELELRYFDHDKPLSRSFVIKLVLNGNLIGDIVVRKRDLIPDPPYDHPHTPCWQVGSIEVARAYRRKGFATLLYLKAAQVAANYGMALCSDTPLALSDEALAFWEKQVRKGRAYWEVPGPPEREGFNWDLGRYVLRFPLPASLEGWTG